MDNSIHAVHNKESHNEYNLESSYQHSLLPRHRRDDGSGLPTRTWRTVMQTLEYIRISSVAEFTLWMLVEIYVVLRVFYILEK